MRYSQKIRLKRGKRYKTLLSLAFGLSTTLLRSSLSGVLVCQFVELVRDRGLGGLPIDRVALFVASVLVVTSPDIATIYNIPSTLKARLTVFVIAMFPLAMQ